MEIKCCLCNEVSLTYRVCQFGNERKHLCPKCLSQWTIKDNEIVLNDRWETEQNGSK